MALYQNSTLFLLLPDTAEAAELYPHESTLARDNRRLDSGIDLPCPAQVTIGPGEVVKINLGVRAVCLRATPGAADTPPGGLPWAYRLVPRSSISKTPLMLANGEGIIDLGYRGPLIAAARNVSGAPYTVEAGTALFQLVGADLAPPEFQLLSRDDPRAAKYFGGGATLRGADGFGSTGRSGSAKS